MNQELKIKLTKQRNKAIEEAERFSSELADRLEQLNLDQISVNEGLPQVEENLNKLSNKIGEARALNNVLNSKDYT